MNSRYFNRVEIVNDTTVKKTSTDIFKMSAEYAWYQNAQNFFIRTQVYDKYNIGVYYPTAFDYWETSSSAGYSMSYIHGYTLAHYFLTGDIEPDVFSAYLEVLRQLLDNLPSKRATHYEKMCLQSMYKDKTLARLAEANIDIDKEYKINDHNTPTIREIVDNCAVDIEDSYIKEIHGDLCFSNILVAESPLNTSSWLHLIDPRGYIPGIGITNMGDINYDVAKLAHSIIGRYDQIKSEGFFIEKLSEREYTWSIHSNDFNSEIEDAFKNIFSDFDYYNIMIHLFLSMIPLHKDEPLHQEKMLVNALRLYLQKENKF